MSMIGIFLALFALSGFGVQPNPNAPTAAQISRYAPADADYTVFVDLDAILPGTVKLLAQLPTHPLVQASPQLQKLASRLPAQFAGMRRKLKDRVGVDPVTDLHWIAAWMRVEKGGKLRFVVAVRGLGQRAVDELNRKGHSASRNASAPPAGASPAGASRAAAAPAKKPSAELAGLGADGTFLYGHRAWVQKRLRKGWRPLRVSADVRAALAGKPMAALVSAPGKPAVQRIRERMRRSRDGIAQAFFTSHTSASLSLFHTGLRWTWTARDKAGHSRALMASDGVVSLLRAGHQALRGMARVGLAAAGTMPNLPQPVRDLLAKPDVLLALIDSNSGDGTFKVNRRVRAKRRSFTVEAHAKHLYEVLPTMVLVPIAAASVFGIGNVMGPMMGKPKRRMEPAHPRSSSRQPASKGASKAP